MNPLITILEDYRNNKISINEAVEKLEILAVKGRKDELNKFSEWYYFDRLEGKELPIENYKDERIADIESQLETEQ